MEIIEQIQKLAPWAAELHVVPKIILSGLIAGVAALFLAVIWTTPSETEKITFDAVKAILQGRY
jgi:hypothetical protein